MLERISFTDVLKIFVFNSLLAFYVLALLRRCHKKSSANQSTGVAPQLILRRPPRNLSPRNFRSVIRWFLASAAQIFDTDLLKRSISIGFGITTLILLGLCVFALAPADPERFSAFNMGLRIAGHRGLKDEAPEGTIAGIRLAKKLGADWVDIDMQFSRDNIPVIFNGENVNLTTDGNGPVSVMTLDELKQLNAAANFRGSSRDLYKFEHIPTLLEALTEAQRLGLKVSVEIKPGYPKAVRTIAEFMKENEQFHDIVVFVSFDLRPIYNLKKADPRIITGYAWRQNQFSCVDAQCKQLRYSNPFCQQISYLRDVIFEWFFHNWLFKISGANYLWVERSLISRQYIDDWKLRGAELIAFTANDRNEKLYYLNILHCQFVTNSLSDIQDVVANQHEHRANKIHPPQ